MTATTTAYAGGLERRQVRAWRNAIFVTFAVCGLAMASFSARLATVRDDLGATYGEVAILVVGVSIGSIIGLLTSSHVVAWLGTQRTIALTFVVGPVGFALAGVAEYLRSYPLMMVGLVIFGLAFSVCDVAMNLQGAVIERVIGRTIMPVFHAFFSFGTVIGAAVGWLLERAHVPVVLHIVAVAVVMLVSVQIAARALRSEHTAEDPDAATSAADEHVSWRDRLRVWRDPLTIMLGLIALGMALAEGSASDWLQITSVDGHGLTNDQGTLVFGAFVASMTVGRLAGSLVLDRFGRVPVLRGAAVLAVLGIVAFVWAPITPVAIAGVVLWGLGTSLGFPVAISAAADDPRVAAARVSAVATIAYCAFFIGPAVIGLLADVDWIGPLHALTFVLVLVAVSGLLSGAARQRSRAGGAADAAASVDAETAATAASVEERP